MELYQEVIEPWNKDPLVEDTLEDVKRVLEEHPPKETVFSDEQRGFPITQLHYPEPRIRDQIRGNGIPWGLGIISPGVTLDTNILPYSRLGAVSVD